MMIVLGEGAAAAESVATQLDGLVTTLTTSIGFDNILPIIVKGVGACAVPFLGWFGVRKLISAIQRAVKKGKISV